MDKYLLISSPMRTGSTLLYNFFKRFPGEYIVKKYHISPMDPQKYDYFVTLRRHPVACISSYIQMQEQDYNKQTIEEAYKKFIEEFEWIDFLDNSGRGYPIKYEDFYNDHFYIKEFAEKNFFIYVNDNELLDFSAEFNFWNVKEMSRKEGPHFFQKNHISKHLGRNELHIQQMKKVDIMTDELKDFSERYGYEY